MDVKVNDLVKLDTAWMRKTPWGRKNLVNLKKKKVDGRKIGQIIDSYLRNGINYGTVRFNLNKGRAVAITLYSESFKIIEASPRHPLTSIFK